MRDQMPKPRKSSKNGTSSLGSCLRLTLLVSLMASCSESGPPSGPAPPPRTPPRAATVTVNPPAVELHAWGDTVRLTAEVRDQYGETMSGVSVTWESSAPDIATVGASGLVTAVSNGAATISAATGSVSGNASATVERAVATKVEIIADDPVLFSLDPYGREYLYPEGVPLATWDSVPRFVPSRRRPAARVLDQRGRSFGSTITWSISDSSVVALRAGELVPTGRGRAILVAESGAVADSAIVAVNSVPHPAVYVPDKAVSSRRLFRGSLDWMEQPGETRSYSLEELIHDRDGDPLVVEVAESENLTASITHEGLTITAGTAEGRADITLSVSDGVHAPVNVAFRTGVGCPDVPAVVDVAGPVNIELVVGQPQPGRRAVRDAPWWNDCGRQAIDAAVASWERALTGPARTLTIDLYVLADDDAAVARGGPTNGRNGNELPSTGRVGFSYHTAMIYRYWRRHPPGSSPPRRSLVMVEERSPNLLYQRTRHEIGHVLGIGTHEKWWENLVDPGRPETRIHRGGGCTSNVWFTGPAASAAIALAGRPDLVSQGVPVSHDCIHWRHGWDGFGATVGGVMGGGGNEPRALTPMALGALSDLGWGVNMDAAERITIHAGSAPDASFGRRTRSGNRM
ncbi:Ig-like domain-containing protein [Candidatus Palauibacter sp.]|uniref:Ig-like domain-containing protein n=1 Tax=Candidatus Palauibacter sp. TaxID=3101350 RepID=UPI003D0CB4E5